MGVAENLSSAILSTYNSFLNLLPSWGQQIVNLFLLILLVVIYAVFIWKFYRFIARKNIIKLNLNQYNKSENPFLSKLIAGVFYLVEYIFVLPFLVFLWFAIFTIFLVLLTESLDIKNILVISVTIIGAVRLISYIPNYGQALAKELAKLLPFTLLAISMTKPGFFDFQRIISHISQIPQFFGEITLYLVFIIFLEMILRIFDFFLSLFGFKDPEPEEEKEKEDS